MLKLGVRLFSADGVETQLSLKLFFKMKLLISLNASQSANGLQHVIMLGLN